MAAKLDRAKVAELSKEIRERVCLSYRPIGVARVEKEEQIPEGARRPRGEAWPLCLAENMVRTYGWTIALTADDSLCLWASAGFGFIELPDYLKDGGMGCHHTKTEEIGLKIQRGVEDCFFKLGSAVAVVVTPADAPLIDPEGVYFYGNPTQVGKIAKGIAWYRGEPVPAVAGGLAACVIGAWAAIKDKRPRVILPCSGEKILGQTEENDIFIAVPPEELPDVVEGMKETDFILPYPNAKSMVFQPRIPKSYPIDVMRYKQWKAGKKFTKWGEEIK